VTCGRSVIFSRYYCFLYPNHDCHDITDILWKVTVYTIALIVCLYIYIFFLEGIYLITVVEQVKETHD